MNHSYNLPSVFCEFVLYSSIILVLFYIYPFLLPILHFTSWTSCSSFFNTLFITAFCEYVELTVVPFRSISRLPSYKRCTGNSFIISSSSSIFGTIGTGIKYILTQIWNVFAVALHIVGFPTDACCASLQRCCAPVTSVLESCCVSAPRHQQHTPTLLPMSVDMSGARSGNSWGGGGPTESRGHTLGGRGTTSTLTGLSSPIRKETHHEPSHPHHARRQPCPAGRASRHHEGEGERPAL